MQEYFKSIYLGLLLLRLDALMTPLRISEIIIRLLIGECGYCISGKKALNNAPNYYYVIITGDIIIRAEQSAADCSGCVQIIIYIRNFPLFSFRFFETLHLRYYYVISGQSDRVSSTLQKYIISRN